jgi:two-component system response regulator HydG
MAQDSFKETAILVVDDEVSLRNTFRTFLARAGYEPVIAVSSFEEAVQAVSTRMFDLIICDIVLESHSGIALLKRFRQLGVTCPVVIVTGYPHVDTASEAVRLGAFDYLAKPVEKEALLKTARLAVQHYRLEKEKSRAEQAREQYRQLLETIFRSVSDCIISVDRDLRILKMNQAADILFQAMGLDLHEGGDLEGLRGSKDFCSLREELQRVVGCKAELTDIRLETFLGGSCKLLSCRICPLDDAGSSGAGAVLVIRDITYRAQADHEERSHFHRLLGVSAPMQNVYRMIENIGKVDTSVLVTGESGTGKELVVHALHMESARRDRPLITVDCTAIPENLLESELFGHKKGAFTGAEENRMGRILQASGGTLFLDEIGNISMATQLRLLRFLQEKTFYPVGRDREVKVDVRVIAATNVDLKEKVKSGAFREDLYFRLLIIDIHLPPLRERKGDIPLLSEHFCRLFADRLGKGISGISEQAQAALCRYRWPGNVRQLEHVMERACILCQGATISTEHLPPEIVGEAEADSLVGTIEKSEGPGPNMSRPSVSRELSSEEQAAARKIIDALRKSGGNKAKAARLLQVDRSTLYRKMRELHLDLNMFSD